MPSLPLSVEEFASILHRCRNERNLAHALQLHDAFVSLSQVQAYAAVASQLVLVLVELGSFHHARHIFSRLPHQQKHFWNNLIIGYVKHKEPQHALNLYQIVGETNSPCDYTFVALLKACVVLKHIEDGLDLHVEIVRRGLLQSNIFVGCSLVDMYAKCGKVAKADEVLLSLPIRDVVSWNALLTGYAENGQGKKAIECLELMRYDGVSGNPVTFVCCLKACASIGLASTCQELHSEIVKNGFEHDYLIQNTLIDVYAKCGFLITSQEVFNELPIRDVVSWNTLLGGLLDQDCYEEVLSCWEKMQEEGTSLNNITSVYILKACSSLDCPMKGQEAHIEIVYKGLEREPLIGSALVDLYSKCGCLAEAQEVFDNLPCPDVVPWTALMAGYAEHGDGQQTLDCFEEMQQVGISPDAFTFSCSLKACGSKGQTDKGKELHADIVRKGLEKESLVGNTLVNMYANFGWLSTAHHVFEKLPIKDMVSLNALIVVYTDSGQGQEAVQCFEEMQGKGIPLNAVTIICTLKACCSMGSVVKGRQIHLKVAKTGFDQEVSVGNALIDLYIKFSSLVEAQVVFDKLAVRDVVSWTSLLAGHAQLGKNEAVFFHFDRMIEYGIRPNLVTFVHVLGACNHAGLVNKGEFYFDSIGNDYGLSPTVDHYTCMVDLLGRSGHIDKAVAMIRKMPVQPDLVVWHTMLGACRKWKKVDLGRNAFENALRLDERASATYLFMINIYRDAGMLEEAQSVEALRIKNQAWS